MEQITKPSGERIRERYKQALQRIREHHIKTFEGQPGPVVLISSQYPGVWLEHAFDALCYARLFPERPDAQDVLRGEINLFLDNQKEDGHLPFCVRDPAATKWGFSNIAYAHIQECVSFATICLEAYGILRDLTFLEKAYKALSRWDDWLCINRMTTDQGLIETFCLYDTGHDNSARFAGIPNGCPDAEGKVPADAAGLPMLSPDMNAVFYGDRRALAQMARLLGEPEEAEIWEERAQAVRCRMFELLYDKDDAFFYDRDSSGNLRKIRNISITNVFTEHLLTQEEFDEIYYRHFRNPEEFGTPYPFPSIALNAPETAGHADRNCWGYYSQALTALRCMRWMDDYSKTRDYNNLLRAWVDGIAAQEGRIFTQELDPVTGRATECSEWYSSAMLLYIYAVRRLGLLA